MKTWNVRVRGIGGPVADFHQRTYEVKGESAGYAVDKAIGAYHEMHGAQYKFYDAVVVAAVNTVQVLP
jgi:hypothetical protein